MTVRPPEADGQPGRPSRKSVAVAIASILAFMVTLAVPAVGAPLIAATGVILAARKNA